MKPRTTAEHLREKEAEVLKSLALHKSQLRTIKAQAKALAIDTLGTLAWEHGLHELDPEYVTGIFRALSQGVPLVPAHGNGVSSDQVSRAEKTSTDATL